MPQEASVLKRHLSDYVRVLNLSKEDISSTDNNNATLIPLSQVDTAAKDTVISSEFKNNFDESKISPELYRFLWVQSFKKIVVTTGPATQTILTLIPKEGLENQDVETIHEIKNFNQIIFYKYTHFNGNQIKDIPCYIVTSEYTVEYFPAEQQFKVTTSDSAQLFAARALKDKLSIFFEIANQDEYFSNLSDEELMGGIVEFIEYEAKHQNLLTKPTEFLYRKNGAILAMRNLYKNYIKPRRDAGTIVEKSIKLFPKNSFLKLTFIAIEDKNFFDLITIKQIKEAGFLNVIEESKKTAIDFEKLSENIEILSNIFKKSNIACVQKITSNIDFSSVSREIQVTILSGLCTRKLTDLSIKNCSELTDATLKLIFENSRNSLKKLSITNCSIRHVVDLLNCEHLQELHINGCGYLSEAILNFGDNTAKVTIKKCQSLNTLIINGKNLTEVTIDDCQVLSNVTIISPSLDSIETNKCSQLVNKHIYKALSPQLVYELANITEPSTDPNELIFDNVDLDIYQANIIKLALVANLEFKIFQLTNCSFNTHKERGVTQANIFRIIAEGFAANTNITTLDLSANDLDLTDYHDIFMNPSLQSINFAKNKMTLEFLKMLATSLQDNFSLRELKLPTIEKPLCAEENLELDLQRNKQDNEVKTRLGNEISEKIAFNKTLLNFHQAIQDKNFDQVKEIFNSVIETRQQELLKRSPSISDDKAIHLAVASRNDAIIPFIIKEMLKRKINLRITNGKQVNVFKGSSFGTLDLSDSNLPEEAAENLFTVLKDCKQIQQLSFFNTYITVQGTNALINWLLNKHELVKLCINEDQFLYHVSKVNSDELEKLIPITIPEIENFNKIEAFEIQKMLSAKAIKVEEKNEKLTTKYNELDNLNKNLLAAVKEISPDTEIENTKIEKSGKEEAQGNHQETKTKEGSFYYKNATPRIIPKSQEIQEFVTIALELNNKINEINTKLDEINKTITETNKKSDNAESKIKKKIKFVKIYQAIEKKSLPELKSLSTSFEEYPDLLNISFDGLGNTALHLAILSKDIHIFNFIINEMYKMSKMTIQEMEKKTEYLQEEQNKLKTAEASKMPEINAQIQKYTQEIQKLKISMQVKINFKKPNNAKKTAFQLADSNGNTALHLAARNGDSDILCFIIDQMYEQQLNLVEPNDTGKTAFELSTGKSKILFAKKLLIIMLSKYEMPKQDLDKTITCSVEEITEQHVIKIVALIKACNGLINFHIPDNKFPNSKSEKINQDIQFIKLYQAITQQSPDELSKLIETYTKLLSFSLDASGNTALHWAVLSGNNNVISTILNHIFMYQFDGLGAKQQKMQTFFDQMFMYQFDLLGTKNKRMQTPLELSDTSGNTVLHWIVLNANKENSKKENKNKKILSFVIAQMQKQQLSLEIKNKAGQTALELSEGECKVLLEEQVNKSKNLYADQLLKPILSQNKFTEKDLVKISVNLPQSSCVLTAQDLTKIFDCTQAKKRVVLDKSDKSEAVNKKLPPTLFKFHIPDDKFPKLNPDSNNHEVEEGIVFIKLYQAMAANSLADLKQLTAPVDYFTKYPHLLQIGLDSQKNTVLHRAALSGNKEILQFIIEQVSKQRFNLETKNQKDQTIFELGTGECEMFLANELLRQFFVLPSNREKFKEHCASYSKYFEKYPRLLQISLDNDSGNTLLHMAVLNKNIHILKFIINEMHAMPKRVIKNMEDMEKQPKNKAEVKKYNKMQKLKLQIQEISFNIRNKAGKTAFELADSNGNTAVHQVALSGDAETLNLVIARMNESKLSLEITNANGQTAFELSKDKCKTLLANHLLKSILSKDKFTEEDLNRIVTLSQWVTLNENKGFISFIIDAIYQQRLTLKITDANDQTTRELNKEGCHILFADYFFKSVLSKDKFTEENLLSISAYLQKNTFKLTEQDLSKIIICTSTCSDLIKLHIPEDKFPFSINTNVKIAILHIKLYQALAANSLADLERLTKPANFFKDHSNLLALSLDQSGNTALHWAVLSGNKDIVTLIVTQMNLHKVSFETKNKAGKTALEICKDNEFKIFLESKMKKKNDQSFPFWQSVPAPAPAESQSPPSSPPKSAPKIDLSSPVRLPSRSGSINFEDSPIKGPSNT